jgi:hypothetical protein
MDDLPQYERLDPEVVAWFVEIAEDCGLEIYHNYSGRGMYGRKTIGVVADFNDFCTFLQFLGTKLETNDREILGGWASDSMGLSSIYYLHM